MSKREDQWVRATDGKTYLVKAEDYELAEKMHEMWEDFSDDVDENAMRIAIYVAAFRARAEKAEARNVELEAGLSTCIGWIATMGVGPRINEVLQDARKALAGKGE